MKKYCDAVEKIKEFINKDIFGPICENEVLEDVEPLVNYVTGILYPKRENIKKSNEDFIVDEIEDIENVVCDNTTTVYKDGELGEIIHLSNKYQPTSFGLSVMVSKDTKNLKICFKCGTYSYENYKDINDNNENEKIEHVPMKFVRTGHINVFDVELLKPIYEKQFDIKVNNEVTLKLKIYLCVRKEFDNGDKLITISIINNTDSTTILHKNSERAAFQCEMSVESALPFLPINQKDNISKNIEEDINNLLYSNNKNYGFGHGCSVDYTIKENEVKLIKTTFIPCREVLQMIPGKISDQNILSLKYLLSANKSEICKKLHNFINEYSLWKDKENKSINNLEFRKKAAHELIKRIEICIKRLEHAINLLETNENVWMAFKYANEAMLLQRLHTKKCEEEDVKWYPFQLAYILMIIPDIIDKNGDFHNVVDLLWFPTGGGKTEAYLGVSAFAIFYRRLTNNVSDDGVSIIMRYTLRLLTIQQFERATALICACEYMRKKYKIQGGEINIGLWIGSGMTPNHIKGTEGAEIILKSIKEDQDYKPKSNPMQIVKCPWCGAEIDSTGYNIVNNQMVISCSNNKNCEFHSKLPIYVVDDDIYENKPTLLLSTIDKFARLAWEDDAYKLFGDKNTSPSLIIQDELHLISGALGSIAGIYEMVIDYVCERLGGKPKIIASTATVKNANEQIKNLYNKEMLQFPPSGISFNDSFFSRIASKNERPARTYIGICENGGSMADLSVRIYGLLSYLKMYFEKTIADLDVKDQYYTIIGYFNAIRDLGATSNILSDRLVAQVKNLIKNKFKDESENKKIEFKDYRYSANDELTSRKTAKQIIETLIKLEKMCNEDALGYVLASNMLSVGIDISRLGLMVVYNQPKMNAEYIQATSRVGRKNPGLVITMYNAMRTRDKSHYEQFNYYHDSLYQYVESTSVTPYSPRALEKALPSVFVAMVRLTIESMRYNKNASNIYSSEAEIEDIKNYIVKKIADNYSIIAESVDENLLELIRIWKSLVDSNPNLHYYSSNKAEKCLLNSAEEESISDFPKILNSLRNVESSSNVFVEL